MKTLLFALLLGFVALVQSVVLPHVALLGIWPNVVVLTTISWTLLRGLTEGLTWAFIGGVWLDVLSGAPFGLSLVSLLLVAYLVSSLEASLFRDHIVLVMAIIAGATFLFGAFHLALLRLISHPSAHLAVLWRTALPIALYTSLLTPLLFPPVRWLHRVSGREPLEW